MFGISFEHLLLLGIVVLIVGPRRLPEVGNSLGKFVRNLKDGMSGVEEAKFRRLEEEKTQASKPQPTVQAEAASETTPKPPVT